MRTKFMVGLAMILALGLMVSGCAKKTADEGAKESYKFTTPDPAPAPAPTMVQSGDLTPEQQKAYDALTTNKIYFDFDKFDLKPEAKEVLKGKAAILKKYDGWKMLVEGHCDERGTEEYNLALGERRARAAYEHLVILGVEPERMKIVSYGEEYPVDPGHNETAWAKNRRDEFIIK